MVVSFRSCFFALGLAVPQMARVVVEVLVQQDQGDAGVGVDGGFGGCWVGEGGFGLGTRWSWGWRHLRFTCEACDAGSRDAFCESLLVVF
jgi:hypothetical protein